MSKPYLKKVMLILAQCYFTQVQATKTLIQTLDMLTNKHAPFLVYSKLNFIGLNSLISCNLTCGPSNNPLKFQFSTVSRKQKKTNSSVTKKQNKPKQPQSTNRFLNQASDTMTFRLAIESEAGGPARFLRLASSGRTSTLQSLLGKPAEHRTLPKSLGSGKPSHQRQSDPERRQACGPNSSSSRCPCRRRPARPRSCW